MFGKSRTVSTTKFQRADLQPILEATLAQVLKDLGVPIAALDVPHGRRTLRALIRVAARVAWTLGCDMPTFVVIARDAFASESRLTPRAEA